MRVLTATLLAVPLAILADFVYGLDQWLGVIAFTYWYLLFCAMVALLYWSVWFMTLKKYATLVGSAAFAVLAAVLLLPPPSERILMSALLRVPPGTDSDAIERIVEEEYGGSGYALPRITKEDARVYVSLLSQEAGNCTTLIFKIEDGIVVSGEYIPD